MEFNRDFDDDTILMPWDKEIYAKLFSPKTEKHPVFFAQYEKEDTKGWMSWKERFLIQMKDGNTRQYFEDNVGIYGEKGQLSFSTQYQYFRLEKNESWLTPPESFKEGFLLDFPDLMWLTWDYPISSITYAHNDFNIGLYRQPIYWGYSPSLSPLLSNNVTPLPYMEWSAEFPYIRYKHIHGRLSPNEQILPDTINTFRNLAAHRVEFDVNPSFEFSFNEFIVYANRELEWGYLNPVNFLFAEEHIEGNRDNLLMALDFKYRPFNGLNIYGTWFLDELNFFKLFSGWWGNKFVFQSGLTFTPKQNVPNINIEYTAARPWTYSHQYPSASFTSAGHILGFPLGPNSQVLAIRSQWQSNVALHLAFEYLSIKQGSGEGSDPLASYVDHGEEINTFLSGDIQRSSEMRLNIHYRLMESIRIISNTSYTDDTFMFENGVEFRW